MKKKKKKKILDKVVELVGGGFVINGATPSSLNHGPDVRRAMVMLPPKRRSVTVSN